MQITVMKILAQAFKKKVLNNMGFYNHHLQKHFDKIDNEIEMLLATIQNLILLHLDKSFLRQNLFVKYAMANS